MYAETAAYYDVIYDFKDYEQESRQVIDLVDRHLRSGGNRLLDVACGTGRHLEYLGRRFQVEGLDLSPELLEIAHRRNPGVPLHRADMVDFDLGRAFDVITCLFSSIGYVKTLEALDRALSCMARHLLPGGLLVVEPWFTPDAWQPHSVHAQLIDEPELKIARVNTSFVQGRLSYFDLHHLIGTPQGTQYLVERHELGLFETHEMHEAFVRAGFQVTYDDQGLTGRGLFLGLRPPTRHP
jgi:SAM-dependent methyltransferase